MSGLKTRMIKVIDAKEEIILTLLNAVENNPELDQINEKDIRNLIALLINTQFDSDLKKTQAKMKTMIENILDLRTEVGQ
jgi:hypothetical protein